MLVGTEVDVDDVVGADAEDLAVGVTDGGFGGVDAAGTELGLQSADVVIELGELGVLGVDVGVEFVDLILEGGLLLGRSLGDLGELLFFFGTITGDAGFGLLGLIADCLRGLFEAFSGLGEFDGFGLEGFLGVGELFLDLVDGLLFVNDGGGECGDGADEIALVGGDGDAGLVDFGAGGGECGAGVFEGGGGGRAGVDGGGEEVALGEGDGHEGHVGGEAVLIFVASGFEFGGRGAAGFDAGGEEFWDDS